MRKKILSQNKLEFFDQNLLNIEFNDQSPRKQNSDDLTSFNK